MNNKSTESVTWKPSELRIKPSKKIEKRRFYKYEISCLNILFKYLIICKEQYYFVVSYIGKFWSCTFSILGYKIEVYRYLNKYKPRKT